MGNSKTDDIEEKNSKSEKNHEQLVSIEKNKLEENKISDVNKSMDAKITETVSNENQKDKDAEQSPRVSARRKSRVQDGEGELNEESSSEKSVPVNTNIISGSSKASSLIDKKVEEKKDKDKEEKTQNLESKKGSDTQKMKKNLIITSVEVHQSENSDGKQEGGSSKRIERRQSLRKSKDEQELKNEDEKETQDGRKSPKEKKLIKDTKSKDAEMNKITIEDGIQSKKTDEKKISNIRKKGN